jgi:hypothetical protein
MIYDGPDDFRAMCRACFGEAPELRETPEGYADKDGRLVFGQRFFEATVEAAGIPAGHGSVSALAARLDIQRATVSRWKSGKQAPTPEHQAAIAERLGMALCVIYDVGRWFITYQDGT